MSRFVMVGDPHLDAVTMGVSRFEEIVGALHQTVDCAIETRADGWVCLGDLWDPDAGPVAYRALREIIHVALRLRVHKISSLWIAGNHDVVEDGTGTTTLSPLQALRQISPPDGPSPGYGRCHVAEGPEQFALGFSSPPVVALPYTATSHAYDPAKYLRDNVQGKHFVVAGHLVVPGVSPGDESVEYARGRDVFFPVEEAQRALAMVNGHHHRRQRSTDGVLIPGSLARLTFGEAEHEPGFLVVEV